MSHSLHLMGKLLYVSLFVTIQVAALIVMFLFFRDPYRKRGFRCDPVDNPGRDAAEPDQLHIPAQDVEDGAGNTLGAQECVDTHAERGGACVEFYDSFHAVQFLF